MIAAKDCFAIIGKAEVDGRHRGRPESRSQTGRPVSHV